MLAQVAPVGSFVKEAPDGIVFDAGFQFKSDQFSGLMAVNPIENGWQVDFLSKMGNTLFIVKLFPDSADWEKFIPGVTPKANHLKALEQSLRIVLLLDLESPKKIKLKSAQKFNCKGNIPMQCITNDAGTQVIAVRERGWFKIFRRKVDYTYVETELIPSEIGIAHGMINFGMTLKRLN